MLQKIKAYAKKPWVIILTALVIIAIVIFAVRSGSGGTTGETITVKSGTVREEVSVTGKVKAAQAVDLSFEKSGKVTKVTKAVGDRVSTGEIIVQIDNSDIAAELAQAQAGLRYQQSKLAELNVGTRPEQVDITKAKLVDAETGLANARLALLTSLQKAYSSADDAIRNKVDSFFIDPRSNNPKIAFTSTITSETSLESGRVEVERRLRAMRDTLAALTPTSDLKSVLDDFKSDLGEIKLFMDNISLPVNALTATTYLSQTTITTWKTDLSTARAGVNAAIADVLTNEEKYNTAVSGYDIASRQLTLDTSGVVNQQITAQQAQVAQAQANVSAVYAQLSKTYLRAPIDGIVTKQETKLGETVPLNTTVVSVMSDATFEIEANIPEADIAKVRPGQIAKVTLDAYGSEVVFNAKVASIDPAETVIDGVATYKTTLQFDDADTRIKSGMTANVDIAGQAHEGVLYLPQRAIQSRGTQKVVTLKDGDTTREVSIRTGLRGSDGSVEILGGISLGDEVLVSQK